ncbi:MAG: CCA tRNA nucleotidyltransferase [Fibrobacterota bacterium]
MKAINKAHAILRRLHEAGHTAFLVGGCVRDMVMGLPVKDTDIATSARPDQVQALFPRHVAIGAHFGVILVMDGDDSFEVATFRADDRYIDGRRPVSVRFVSAEEDVLRRDFTVNGLLYDVVQDRVIDHVNGLADIRNRILRTIGPAEARFSEDKLRLLRAVRFAARLDFTIEPATFSAIGLLATRVTEVSCERIRDEILKMLMDPRPAAALRLMRDTGLLAATLPEIAAMIGVAQPEAFHPEGDVFDHTLLMLNGFAALPPEEKNAVLALAVLLHDVGKPDTFYQARDRIRFNNHPLVGRRITETLLKRLKLPNQTIQDVAECVDNHMNFINAKGMRQNTLKRFLRRPTFPAEMVLHRLDCQASHGDLEIYGFLLDQVAALGKERISPPPLLTGKRLIEMGYTPGPGFKKILTSVEDLQLEDKIRTQEEAESYVRSTFPR